MNEIKGLRDGAWQVADLTVDRRSRSVRRGRKQIKLPRLSLDLLVALVEAAPTALSTDQLLARVWKGAVVSPTTVTKRVELLRHALGDNSEAPRYIALEHGYGYRLVPQPQPVVAPSQSEGRWVVKSLGPLLGVIALAATAVVLYALLRPDTVAEAPPERSIAVLPFADLSQEGDQAWFANGLAEEVINVLVRIPDLRVAARTSSFRYRDSDKTVMEIGRKLGVANVLEGSVRSSADRVRVTVQMIRTEDGFHVWSDKFDRESADVISIQEDLAQKIARVLQTSMDPKALNQMSQVGTESVPAYLEYLMGLQERQEQTLTAQARERFETAYWHFERARELDPGFFSAHVAAAQFWKSQLSTNTTTAGITDLRPAEILAHYQERMSAAEKSARNEADKLLVMAELAEVDLRFEDTLGLYEQYLEIRPNDDQTRYAAIYTAVRAGQIDRGRALIEVWLNLGLDSYQAASLFSSSGYLVMEPSIAAEHLLRVIRNWPNDPSLLYQAHRTLLWAGMNGEASELLARFSAVSPARTPPILEMRGACARGDRKAAERIYSGIDTGEPNYLSVHWLMSEMLGYDQAIVDTLKPLETNGIPYQLASLLAYKQFDPRPFPSLMAILEREGIDRPPPTRTPFACPPAAIKNS